MINLIEPAPSGYPPNVMPLSRYKKIFQSSVISQSAQAAVIRHSIHITNPDLQRAPTASLLLDHIATDLAASGRGRRDNT
jgi:hypothetical protein